jgi:hypothetical protein
MTKLEKNALGRVPLEREPVELIYRGATDEKDIGILRRLCESHERLRMELDGLRVLTNQGVDAIGPPSVYAKAARVPWGWGWIIWLDQGNTKGLQESGVAETAKEAADAMRQGIANLVEVGYWKDDA